MVVHGLEEWAEAIRVAAQEGRIGRFASLAPNGREALRIGKGEA